MRQWLPRPLPGREQLQGLALADGRNGREREDREDLTREPYAFVLRTLVLNVFRSQSIKDERSRFEVRTHGGRG